jgi:hypothetical protein
MTPPSGHGLASSVKAGIAVPGETPVGRMLLAKLMAPRSGNFFVLAVGGETHFKSPSLDRDVGFSPTPILEPPGVEVLVVYMPSYEI